MSSRTQQEAAVAARCVTGEQIADFLECIRTTSAEDARLYILSNGTVRLAVKRFHKDQTARTVLKEATPPPIEPRPLTLLEEALKAHLESPKPKQRDRQIRGDTVVILDGKDLSRNCRLNFSDFCIASPMFMAEPDTLPGDEELDEVQGARHLYILLHSSNGEMPKFDGQEPPHDERRLLRRDLHK